MISFFFEFRMTGFKDPGFNTKGMYVFFLYFDSIC